ncbi:hypothetical protein HDIA_0756 [Hartmannibacter diazotrophicus]|uniref:Uncharacterized protein n=1 Tax=Hartmannibacter diazotrophicus TaxID=1482074 RepID=A0A2C9D1P8_9HYPH|nr:hypothetical protein [Hartmannibacter diazotrophicus]SON54297.1 hypothetical protein HDIA_0756 [Hartmannibacter diazotrophicus]
MTVRIQGLQIGEPKSGLAITVSVVVWSFLIGIFFGAGAFLGVDLARDAKARIQQSAPAYYRSWRGEIGSDWQPRLRAFRYSTKS